ncbi:MAG: N-6 DNA methylase [Treponema sp.]|nr:N-6 DNA methylase [Treponema sp.]
MLFLTYEYAKKDLYKRANYSELQMLALSYLFFKTKKENWYTNKTISENEKVKQLLDIYQTKEITNQAIKDFILKELESKKEDNISIILKTLESTTIESIIENMQFSIEKKEVTPDSISKLCTKLLDIKEKDSLVDFFSGSCNFLYTASLESKAKNYIAIDKNKNIEALSAIKNEILGNRLSNEDLKIYNQDIFNLPKSFSFSKGFCDMIYITHDFQSDYLRNYVKKRKETFADKNSYIMHYIISKLEKQGTMIFCLPPGTVTTRPFIDIRNYLIENKLLKAVISMPRHLYSYTAISTNLVIISKEENEHVMFVNAENISTGIKRNLYTLTETDINNIYNLYKNENGKLSRKIALSEIKKANLDFTPARYLESLKVDFGNIKEYRKLGSLCTITRGIQIPSSKLDEIISPVKTKYQYLNLKNIINNKIADTMQYLELKEDSKELYKYSKYSLKENDILLPMVVTNPIRCALAENIEDKCIIVASNLYIIRLNTNIVKAKYIKILFESPQALDIFRQFSNGTVMQSISVEMLKELEIPMPSIKEQENFLEKYEKLEKEENQLLTRIEKIGEEKACLLESFLN